MSRIAFVVSDEGLGGVAPFGSTLQKMGLIPVLLTGSVHPARLENWSHLYSHMQVLDDPYNPDILVEAAVRIANGRSIAALFSCYDGLVIPAAYAAERLKLPHPAIVGLEQSRNKYTARIVASQHGLAVPAFALVQSIDDCTRAATVVGFPAIIKPLNGMASHLVSRVNTVAELCQTYLYNVEHLLHSFRGNYTHLPLQGGITQTGTANAQDATQIFLVERMLTGTEYSAEVLVRDGEFIRVALFHKFLVDQEAYLEAGFTSPPLTLNSVQQEEIWEAIEAYFHALGVDQAAANVEIMYTAESPILIEANVGRAGGQILVKAVHQSMGIDLLAEIASLASGLPRPPISPPLLTEQLTTLTFFPRVSGRLESISGLHKVAALPGVVEVIPFYHPGDIIDTADKEVFALNVLVHGICDLQELEQLYQEAHDLIRFVMSTSPVDIRKG